MITLKIITIILIAISLSMDAFSLALIYGTQGIPKKHKLLLATIVGLYHLIMPLIGLQIGKYIENRIIFNSTIVVGIILSLIAIEMIISSFKEKEEKFVHGSCKIRYTSIINYGSCLGWNGKYGTFVSIP